jgi:hypothetical protein
MIGMGIVKDFGEIRQAEAAQRTQRIICRRLRKIAKIAQKNPEKLDFIKRQGKAR